MHIENQNPVFKILAKPIRKMLLELGFLTPTQPQIMAFRPILAGKNVLLIAPTGSGKTEAVLLPILSKLIQQEEKAKGISVLYITPLRALNRDMFKRLTLWSNRLGISVEVRHGDTEAKIRRKQARSPPQILVTTPETLQAILPGSLMRKHLSNVQHVIVDEVHELASSKRGVQLTLALERLREMTGKEFQRIGVSATVGNPKNVAKFIAGTNRPINLICAMLTKDFCYKVEKPTSNENDYELAGKLKTTPEAAARIRRLLELIESHKATLIFVNSRKIAEMLGHKFSQLGRTDIAVHHGSLSKEERVKIEDEFKAGLLKAIICTSTLELGIDIGNVDLSVQYMSPRQVSPLVQRVGRSGHRLDMLSKGVIITVFPDDTLEAIAAVKNARGNRIEPVLYHEKALDVLAHQILGILMDREEATIIEVAEIVHRAYPYCKLPKNQLLNVIRFLNSLNQLIFYEEGEVLRKTSRSRKHYYNNLSMIPDERRYPVINVLSDRKIGTLGDEFMAFDARIGLNFIMRGKVWRIVQIEEETGKVYVVPSEDPFAAIPGWDGEILPVPFDLAQQTGKTREKIGRMLTNNIDAIRVAEKLSKKMHTDKASILDIVREIEEYLKEGAPLPTHNYILIEAFNEFLIIHACFGEIVNRTLGGVIDSILTEKENIIGWWTDGYRILVETTRRLTRREVEKLPSELFNLTSSDIDFAFKKYVDSKFPFAAKMKHVAERFGVLPKGKTMSYERQSNLRAQFEKTPIYEETLREAMLERIDLKEAKKIMRNIRQGKMKVGMIYRSEKPTNLAYHILTKYADISELMAPERVLLSNIEKMKMAIEARTATLFCFECGKWTKQIRIRSLPEKPECEECSSGLLTLLYRNQDANHVKDILLRRNKQEKLSDQELRELTQARRKADLILSYGKDAIRALEVKGVGPETASRILGKMHPKEDDLYLDLLKAKIQFLRTRQFWKD